MHVHARRTLCAAVFAAAIATTAIAAEGDLDPTFGDGGFRLAGILDGSAAIVAGMAVQPDGKIVICETEGSTALDFFVARFTADGAVDTSFSFDGHTTVDFSGGSDTCSGLVVQSDGKIVVVGTTIPDQSSNSDFAIARLNSDGTLDTAAFGNGTGKSVVGFDLGGNNADNALAVALRTDGRIVVAGSAATGANGLDFAILQLNTDGSRDTGFNLTGRVAVGFDLAGSTTKDDQATQVAIDAAGRILAAGAADHGAAGGTDMAVLRLLPSGQPDADFNADGRATLAFDLGGANGGNDEIAVGMKIDRQERIVLTGTVDSSPTSGTDPQTANSDVAVARLLPDGSPDSAFGIGGKTVIAFDLAPNGTDYGVSILEQGNGRLYIAGTSIGAQAPPAYEYATLMRLLPDGTPDQTFGVVGKRLYDFEQSLPSGQLFNGIAAQGSKIVLGGALNSIDLTHIDFVVARITDDVIFADSFE
ncbi:MAG TPA: delta-60 repeat domain-containing protein [Dokdonella sp.]|nr:delta-60 repeat domain-containing protein [Dokdonella sp.]